MKKTMKNLVKAANKVICGIGWVYCTLVLLAVSALADDASQQPGVSPEAVIEEPSKDVGATVSEFEEDERVQVSRKVRQLHADWIKVRRDAASEDPEIDRMEKRIKALEAEASRMRTEMNDRIDKLPVVREAKQEFDAAQRRLDEINAKFRESGVRGRRAIHRKPNAGGKRPAGIEGSPVAVEEGKQVIDTAESAVESGE